MHARPLGAMLSFKILPAGDTALVVEFGETVDRQISAHVLALSQRLSELELIGVIETVPTFRSLMIHFDPLVLSPAVFMARLADLMRDLEVTEQRGHWWRLPVCYDPDLAPDLDFVAERTGLSPAQVVERHSAVTYHVYMLGFLPGQAYMGDLPGELALPRREAPRLAIPAGSLAIAATTTCIFPLETPCGWHIVGRSPVPLWRHGISPAALLAPGDKVMFTPVSLREYEVLLAQAAAGTLDIRPGAVSMQTAA